MIDEDHLVSSAFNFVNVPSAAWIDESGRIVRIDEGTYAKLHELSNGEQSITFGVDSYAPALKDWVAKGADSRHVQSAKTVTGNIRPHGAEELRALCPALSRMTTTQRTAGRASAARESRVVGAFRSATPVRH